MKKKLTLVASICLAFAASAQMIPQNMEKAHAEFRKEKSSRVPQLKAERTTVEMPTDAKNARKLGANETYVGSLPADRWFPGEWEEVKAIVVTWPYWSVPANYQQISDLGNYDCEPTFSGYGSIYHYINNQWQNLGFGEIDQLPYVVNYTINATGSTMQFTNVFAYLIDGIRQGGAEPWVRVTHLSDSTLIKQHMQYIGLSTDGIKWLEGFGDSFWFRDCGPICFYYGDEDSIGMLDFMYYPGRAIDDSLPSIIAAQKDIRNFITSIEWEGGNCVVDGDGLVISSDHIYSANADTYGQLMWAGPTTAPSTYGQKNPLTQAQVRDSLAYMMGPRGVKIMPAFQYDGGTGHMDLYTDMLDENRFVFSKFPTAYSNWTDYATAEVNIDNMCSWRSTHGHRYNKSYIPFPSKDDGSNFASQDEYNGDGTQANRGYTRTYSNHTLINNVIVQPCFSEVVDGMPSAAWDAANIEALKLAYPGYRIYPIDVRSFDGYGGALHCITKQIPADSPLRIMHSPIHGNIGNMYNSNDAGLLAYMTNNSGIASAEIRYRVNGGDWQTVALSAYGNNEYGCYLPTSTFTVEDSTEVDYYISATANNGKTITKPMTASQGGYFHFVMTQQPNTSGIESVEAEQNFGQFYPNPATSKASIEINLGNGTNYNVSIFDLSGKTIHTSRLMANGTIEYSINTDVLSSGQYTVVFSNENEKVVRKLIVK